MAITFLYDVFLCYCFKDSEIVQAIASRLKDDGVRIWLDVWEISTGDNIIEKIEEGLEQSRVLVFCMSENTFGSDWTRLEGYTFRFRDPLNKDRRFIPLRLDETPVKTSLAQYQYISWLEEERSQAYMKLLEVCHKHQASVPEKPEPSYNFWGMKVFSLGHTSIIYSVAFSPDGRQVFSGSLDKTVRLWEVEGGRCLRVFEGHTSSVYSIALSVDSRYVLSGSADNTLRFWEVESGRCLRILEGHTDRVYSVALSADGYYALSGSADNTLRLWEVESGRCLRVLEGHTDRVRSVALSGDGPYAFSGSDDKTIRFWEVTTGRCLRILEGHKDQVGSVVLSRNGRYVLSGSADNTLRLWEVESGDCLRVLEGHTNSVCSVTLSRDGRYALSGSDDDTLRLWKVETGHCLRVLEGHADSVWSVALSRDGRRALSGSADSTLRFWDLESDCSLRIFEGHTDRVRSVAWRADGRYALSGSADNTLRLWEVTTGHCLRVLEGHVDSVWSVVWSDDGRYALSGSADNTLRLWEVETGRCLRVLEGHANSVCSVALSGDGRYAFSGSDDKTIRLWELESGRCIRTLEGHTDSVWSVVLSRDSRHAISGSEDALIKLWELESGRCLRVFEGHAESVNSVVLSSDGRYVLSGSNDTTIRLWEKESGRCLRVFEGHAESVSSVVLSSDGRYALSGSEDYTVRLWEVETGDCLYVFEGHTERVSSVAWSGDNHFAYSAVINGVWREWNLLEIMKSKLNSKDKMLAQVQYTNAKVLLVGDSGVGKTGLSNYLVLGIKDEERNTSTDGAWATQWMLPQTAKQDGVEREIWLWDFAGQVDYRLVHQLFMDDTAAAVLVFNPQHENPFEGLGQWNHDLQKATRKPFVRLLAAGRIDRGGLVVSDASMYKFMQEHNFQSPLHLTSAKTGEGCDKLRTAIIKAIDWQNVPAITSPVLYQRMKHEILQLRDTNLVLIRLSELKQRMELALPEEHFEPADLMTVVKLLAGPGMIQRMDFGGFILLRPEVLSRYAAAVVRKVRKHPQELGCIREDELLAGVLDYQDFERLPVEDETIILRTLYETFVSRAWCLRQPYDSTSVLTFPSYFRRERPEQLYHPNVLVTYRFTGPADDIYATLIVRLHHTEAFEADQLWKFAADFKTQTGHSLGLKLTREAEGRVRLEIYFNPDVDENSRLIFLRYIHNHLNQYAQDVQRLRHYCCSNKKCDSYNQPFTDQPKIDKAIAAGKDKVFCSDCGKPIQLHDMMEQKFESSALKEQTRHMQEEVQLLIDNESKELILVGHAYAITGEAGQIYRGYTNSDHGIDGEIEFKDDQGRATGKRLYLQLKSGDSYVSKGQLNGTEWFQIKKGRWADYWQQQACPVFLVIRTSDGNIRWMEVSDYLKRASNNGKKPVKRILFVGEPFNAMSIRRWRDKMLKSD